MASPNSVLPTPLQINLQQIVARANQSGASVRAIILSTTEGVPLGRVYATDQPFNEDVMASIESVWAPASKQFPVLGLEKVKQVTAIYDHGVLVHVYQGPMVRCARIVRVGSLLVLKNLSLGSHFLSGAGHDSFVWRLVQPRSGALHRDTSFEASTGTAWQNFDPFDKAGLA